MSGALRLLWDLRRRGVRIEADGENLRITAPRGVLGDAERAALRAHKAALLGLLGAPCPCAPCARGEEPHGPRCYCAACLDADPKWEAWRAEIAEEDRREAEERRAIQQEGRS